MNNTEIRNEAQRYNIIGSMEDIQFKTTSDNSPCLFFKLRKGPGKRDFVRVAAFDDLALSMKNATEGEKVKLLGIWQQHRIGYRNNMPIKAQRFRAFWYEKFETQNNMQS